MHFAQLLLVGGAGMGCPSAFPLHMWRLWSKLQKCRSISAKPNARTLDPFRACTPHWRLAQMLSTSDESTTSSLLSNVLEFSSCVEPFRFRSWQQQPASSLSFLFMLFPPWRNRTTFGFQYTFITSLLDTQEVAGLAVLVGWSLHFQLFGHETNTLRVDRCLSAKPAEKDR